MKASPPTLSTPFPWLRAFSFIVAAGLLLSGLGAVFDFAARRDLRSKPHWIVAQRGGKYDFAVLGTSRPYLGVDISLLQEELGGRGINLAIDGAGYPEQLLAFRLFAMRNQVTNLILDVNPANLDDSSLDYSFHDYEYLPYQGDATIDAALHSEFGGKALVWKYVPFWKNAEFNSKIGPIQLYTWGKAQFDPRARVAEFDRYGSRLVQIPFHPRYALREVQWTMEPRLKEALSAILRFAEGQGIKVTMIVTPEWHEWALLQLNRAQVIDYYRQLASANRLPLLTFDDLPLVNDTAYYIDTNHLNTTGARIFTRELAARLKALNPPPL